MGGRILLLDPRISGISGDMVIGALVDLIGRERGLGEVADCVRRVIGCESLEYEIEETRRAGIRAKRLVLEAKGWEKGKKGIEVVEAVARCCSSLSLSRGARSFALNSIRTLLEAESAVHGVSVEGAHFHELSSPDTVFDIVGVALLLDEIGVFEKGYAIYTTPPALGSGRIKIAHGEISAPAPAVLEIFRRYGYRYSSIDVPHELTTPTGASIIVNLAREVVDAYPPMKVEGIGYGAGEVELEGIPNVLRVVEGTGSRWVGDKVVVIETNLDDVSGEVLGELVQKLLSKGAMDVVMFQGIGKKNRPVVSVQVISPLERAEELAFLLMEETGSLGVRLSETPRIVALREELPVELELFGKKLRVTVKISRIGDKLLKIKPEFEDIRRIASELDLPLRVVKEEVEAKLKDLRDRWPELLEEGRD